MPNLGILEFSIILLAVQEEIGALLEVRLSGLLYGQCQGIDYQIGVRDNGNYEILIREHEKAFESK